MVECELVRILIDEHHDEQQIVLRECGGERSLPIVIGIFEATVIDRMLKEKKAERPLTHDLLCAVIRSLGAELRAVAIESAQEDVFFATLVLAGASGAEVRVDARPSDAVALALRERVPILVAEAVLARA